MNIRYPQRWQQLSEDDYYEMTADLRGMVSTWTENTMVEDGKFPSLDGFCNYAPEWDHSELYDIIESEITRVREIVEREQQEAALYEDGGEQPEISAFPYW